MKALAVEVDARFDCPQARCIAMTIVAGEGTGSVAETHGTALGPDRCRITEAVFASWSRPGFAVARRLGALIAPYVRFAARRLWVEMPPTASAVMPCAGRLPSGVRPNTLPHVPRRVPR